jgi:hypothetical protein
MHYAFRAGFEKVAVSDQNLNFEMAVGGALATTGVGNLVNNAAVLGAALTGERGDTPATIKLLKTFQQRNPDSSLQYMFFEPEGPGVGDKLQDLRKAHYNPVSHYVQSSTVPSTVAHELGHASAHSPRYHKFVGLHRRLFMPASILAPALTAGMAGNDTAQAVSTYAPLAIAAPVLAEEARATAVGLNYLRKSHGIGKALRAALPLTLAGASYAALPVASVLVSRGLSNLANKKESR